MRGIAAEGLAPGIHPRVAVLSLFGMMNWTYKWHKPGIDPDAAELTAAHGEPDASDPVFRYLGGEFTLPDAQVPQA